MKGYTLLEILITLIVIAIVGVMGFSQYNRFTEKMRGQEAKMILERMRTAAIAYYRETGSVLALDDDDAVPGPEKVAILAQLGLGFTPDTIPPCQYEWPYGGGCRSSHYFCYGFDSQNTDNYIYLYAQRCGANGKPPQYSGAGGYFNLFVYVDTGIYNWTISGEYQ